MPNPKPEIDVEGLLREADEAHYAALSLSSPFYGDDVCSRCQTVWPCAAKRLATALRSSRATNAELQATATVCACTLTAPCKPSCSCANSYLSGGCNRCATYGSEEQRKTAASAIADREKANAELVADRERVDWLEQWLRWRPGSRREIWNGAAGFQCVEKSSDPADKPVWFLRAAIDSGRAARTAEGGEK